MNNNELWLGLLDCEVRPMTRDESMIFMQLQFAAMQGPISNERLQADLQKMFSYQVIDRRLGIFDASGSLKTAEVFDAEERDPSTRSVPDIDTYVKLWCAGISDTPGKCVMWAYTLYLMWKVHGKVTLDTWVQYFPNGVPTEQELHKKWDEQKMQDGRMGNYMDRPRLWPTVVPGVAPKVSIPITIEELLEHPSYTSLSEEKKTALWELMLRAKNEQQ